MYHNVVAQTSQMNFLQQPEQHQSNNQQEPMQTQPSHCCPMNYQGSYTQNQYVPPYQQDPYGVNQQQQQHHQQQPQIQRPGGGNLGQLIGQTPYNTPSIMQNQTAGYGSLPHHILEQIRAYIGSSGPIFILPNNCPNPVTVPQASSSTPYSSIGQGCPGMGLNCPSTPIYCPPSSCFPYPMAMNVFTPFVPENQSNKREINKNCGCCVKKGHECSENYNTSGSKRYCDDQTNEHHCQSNQNDDTVCTKKNCPSAINLQALASQLLAIQGVIPCAATRLVLRKVPGSNITTTMEETVERARRSLNALTQEQLLAETRHAQQVNALINLHMTANPPPNVIPILTTVQLKVNLLKAHVDTSINRRLTECQGITAAEGNGNLNPVILALKSDQELRDLLGTMRQKECEERVNLNFAPYQSQRVIAESRLNSIQNKISQVETEMERRRSATLPRSAMRNNMPQKSTDPGCGSWHGYTDDVCNMNSFDEGTCFLRPTQNYESPDPFLIQVRSPKRLNLKPHVGSPETTYERPKKSTIGRSSRSRKGSDDEDCEDGTKNSSREVSDENRFCLFDKSSDEDSADEDKKKLGGKTIEAINTGNTSEADGSQNSDVSLHRVPSKIVRYKSRKKKKMKGEICNQVLIINPVPVPGSFGWSRRFNQLTNSSQHNDGNEEATNEAEGKAENKQDGIEDNLISGALSTMGNHVASFGSIIGKITALKLHRGSESSRTFINDISSYTRNVSSTNESEEIGKNSAGRDYEESKKTMNVVQKKMGRWKYINLTKINETPNVIAEKDNSNNDNTSYASSITKHAVVGDNRSEGNLVVIKKSIDGIDRLLGEPRKTGRNTVARNRLTSPPQSIYSEQLETFTSAKGSKHENNTCDSPRVVPSKLSGKKYRENRNHDLKSSEKFWLRTEIRETDEIIADASGTLYLIGSETNTEKRKLDTSISIIEAETEADSMVPLDGEHVIELHDYSTVPKS